MTKHVIVPNQLIIHYDIYACNHVCSPQLEIAETTAAEHRLSTCTAMLHVFAVCKQVSNNPIAKHGTKYNNLSLTDLQPIISCKLITNYVC